MLLNLKRTFSSMAAICLTGAVLMLSPCGAAFAGDMDAVTAPGGASATPADPAAAEQVDSTINANLGELPDSAAITAAQAVVTVPGETDIAEITAYNTENRQCDLYARSMSCN